MAQFARIFCMVGVVALGSAACGRSKHHTTPHAGSSGRGAGGKGGAAASAGSSGAHAGGAAGSGQHAAGEAGASGASEAGAAGAPAGAGGANEAGGSGDAGGGGSDDLGTTKVTDVDSFRRAQYDALCRYVFGCDELDSEIQSLRLLLRTEQRCREVFEDSALRAPAFDDLDAKVRAGTIEMDLAAATACIESIVRCEPQSTKRFYDGLPCRAVFRGSSPLGGACSRAEDCANDARCVIGAACPGVCTARVPLGQSCESEADCDDHAGPATCAEVGTSNASALTCEPLAIHRGAANETCSPGTFEMADLSLCAEGLFCDQTSGTCRPPMPADSNCDSDDDVCADGQFCRNGRCQVVSVQERVGDDCDEDYIHVCDFFSRLYCVNQKCELLGDGTEGAACHPIDYAAFSDCNSGLVCLDPASSVNEPSPDGLPRSICGKARAADQPCEENDDCASEYCQTDGTCGAAYCCGEASCQSN